MTDEKDQVQEDADPSEQDDTEGHSLATYEYGRLVARERAQDADRGAREARLRNEARRNEARRTGR